MTFTKLVVGLSWFALEQSKSLEVRSCLIKRLPIPDARLQIYYVWMWLLLIISGTLHGLIFLPVALSFAGGSGYPIQDSDDLNGSVDNDE